MHFLLIGNRENRRTAFFTAVLEKKKIPYTLCSYLDLLEKKVTIEKILKEKALKKETLIRIDSPGENFEVEKQLISLGAPAAGKISCKKALALTYEKGRIYYPVQKYEGFKRFLQDIKKQAPAARFVQDVPDILTMFDKKKTKELLQKNHINSPELITGWYFFEQLTGQTDTKGLSRFFLKLPYSSSASGMAAVMIHQKRKQIICYTTMEMVKKRGAVKMYNSLKVKKLCDRKTITALAEWILNRGGFAERWLPKQGEQNRVFDVRQLVIRGEACHRVVRLSDSPFTNLHLGNTRGPDGLYGEYGGKIKKLAEKAARVFPDSHYAGIDITLSTSGTLSVLELNPFGDLLPGITYKGKSTYEMEIETLLGL